MWAGGPALSTSGPLLESLPAAALPLAAAVGCHFTSCRVSPAAVTPCLLLCPLVRMMAGGWIHLSSGAKCMDFMTVIFHTEGIFSLY